MQHKNTFLQLLGHFSKYVVAGRTVSSSSVVTSLLRWMEPQAHYAVWCGAVRRTGNAGRNFQLEGFNLPHYKSGRKPTHCSKIFGKCKLEI